MKNKYLGGTFLLILIYCGVMQHRNDNDDNETQQSSLVGKKASFVDLKHKKQDKKDILPDSAMTSIYSSIAAKEYNVTKDPVTGIPQSPNRNHNLRAYFKPGTFTLKNRVDSAGHNFKLTLKTEGVYADSKKLVISEQDTATIISENKIQLKQGILTEEYINSEAGVRQNFIVQQAPKGTKELQIRMSPEGLNVKDLSGNRLEFYAESDNVSNKLTYDGLKCWDANGKSLPATLSYKNGLIQIAVNTALAAYPVTIDPIVVNGTPANANAVLDSKQAGARFGYSVASAGDVNGDGYSDVLVGAPNYDAAKPNQGAFFLFLGSSTGIDASKGILYKGDNFVENNNFGNSVSGAGDVNGDGYSDVIVGSYAYSKGQTVDGAIYIYSGSAAGLNLTSVKIESKQADAQLGFSAASAGDVNGDGYSDIIVGAPTFSHGEAYEGAAFIFMGSATGISITASDTLEANQSNSFYGHSVASAGDVNGDGFSDVVVGAYNYDGVSQNEGAAFVYLGSQSGVVSAPHATLHGEHTNSGFGISVSTAGDLNADGYSDLVVGSPAYTNAQGKAGGAIIVYLASSQGAGIQNQSKFIVGGQYGSAFGATVACAGDINGDGFSDVIVGEPDRDYDGVYNQGWTYVYFGSITGNLTIKSFINAGQTSAYVGYSVASAGDVNGDGFSDIIVGAPDYDKSAIDEGIAMIFHGSAASIETNFSAQIMTNQADAEMGFSVSGAGDVNGDGFDDVIVGAPFYDNGANDEGVAFVFLSDDNGVDLSTGVLISRSQAAAQFGYSVGAAGDVNSDGYDDVIVGANLYDMDGVPDCGAGFVYYGSPTGLSLAVPNAVYLPKWGVQAGSSVSGAGDLNADGFDDVIIGVPSHDGDLQSNEGAFVISYGSKAGIKNGGGTVIKGSQTGAELGNSVASAGDVNGDGYDDVIVGSHKFNGNINTPDEGAAFVYYGGFYGLATSGTILDLNNSKALLGCAVAGAGDINGDGFADVIVGAKNYSKGEANEGAAAIFYGSSNGIGANTPTIIEGNQNDALMGSSVSSADVNGDGYTDIIVGATAYSVNQGKEGAVLVYHGSETGINVSLAAAFGGNQFSAQFGYSVSSAGDVNGDGFEDVIVGANKFSGTGRAFMYHGNGDGVSVNNDRAVRGNVHLYNSDLNTNISKDNLGKADFGLGIFAKSFLGRNKGKLVWETVGQGASFSHASPITNSTEFSGEGNMTDLPIAEIELKSLVTKSNFRDKVRARVRFSPTLAITGQMYGPWRYADASILKNPSALPVELVSFNAKAVEKQVDLNWETATEVNSDYFELQRSDDGKQWAQIGHVYSVGDSKSANSYSFIDFSPRIGVNYYRLKMVDQDKTFAYSSIKSVHVEGKTTSLFPNPVLNTLNIDSEISDSEITIHDVSGNEVFYQKNEKGIKAVDVSQLTPGNYLVKLGSKSFHIIKK
jgi:hypothetical protein